MIAHLGVAAGELPLLAQQDLAQIGFHLILYPLSGLFSAARAIETLYRRLHADGTTKGDEHHLMTFSEFNELIGVDEKYALARKFGAE